MTDDEWLRCKDWRPMMKALSGRITARKGRLYICAGLRCIWELLYDVSSRRLVEVVERAVDGSANEEEIRRAIYSAECPTFGQDFDPHFIREHMGDGIYFDSVRRLMEMGVYSVADIEGEGRLGDEHVRDRLENAAHIAYHSMYDIVDGDLDEHLMFHVAAQIEWPGGWLVREIFGNPCRPSTVAAEWRTETVLSLARGAYADRAYDRLPILADSLEEAGCDGGRILLHCRGDGPHVHGCWVLDLVLGRV